MKVTVTRGGKTTTIAPSAQFRAAHPVQENTRSITKDVRTRDGSEFLSPSFKQGMKDAIETVIVRPIFSRNMANMADKASRVAAKAIDKEVDKFFKLARQYMGVNADGRVASDLGVVWSPLTRLYNIRKGKKYKRVNNSFFINQGKLSDQFLNKRGLTWLGKTLVEFQAQGLRPHDKTPRGTLTFTPASKIFEELAGGSVPMNEFNQLLEEEGAISELQMRKLMGRREYYRALLGPLFKSMMRRLPSVVASALVKAGIKNTFNNKPNSSLGGQFEGV